MTACLDLILKVTVVIRLGLSDAIVINGRFVVWCSLRSTCTILKGRVILISSFCGLARLKHAVDAI